LHFKVDANPVSRYTFVMVYTTFTATCPYCLKELRTTEPDFDEHKEACRREAESRAAASYPLGSYGWAGDYNTYRRSLIMQNSSGNDPLMREGENGGGKTALKDALDRAAEAGAPVVIDAGDKIEPGSRQETKVLADLDERRPEEG
jgi:hypothetical protein